MIVSRNLAECLRRVDDRMWLAYQIIQPSAFFSVNTPFLTSTKSEPGQWAVGLARFRSEHGAGTQ